MFVGLFAQEVGSNPIFVKTLYNDFPTVPEFDCEWSTTGIMYITINNFNDLKINSKDNISVETNYINTQSPGMRIESFLNTSHETITIYNYLVDFKGLEDIGGYFTVTYIKYLN